MQEKMFDSGAVLHVEPLRGTRALALSAKLTRLAAPVIGGLQSLNLQSEITPEVISKALMQLATAVDDQAAFESLLLDVFYRCRATYDTTDSPPKRKGVDLNTIDKVNRAFPDPWELLQAVRFAVEVHLGDFFAKAGDALRNVPAKPTPRTDSTSTSSETETSQTDGAPID